MAPAPTATLAPPPTPEPSATLAPTLTGVLPGADAFPGWAPSGAVQTFDRENLYDLVNGQADAFFAYGFEQVAVQSYEDAEGAMLRVTIWRLATAADAYGLFTASRGGAPVAIGNDGDVDPGRRLVFWQDRYYAEVFALQVLPDAELSAFAEAVATALPAGGERPALVDRLPADGLVERSALFFHQEISVQSELWLGGENLLGLSVDTSGVLARYEVDGAVARLLLVEYPNPEVASSGLAALGGNQDFGLVTAGARDKALGAVFGEMDEAAANELLSKALGE
jgi:hypothetical protein